MELNDRLYWFFRNLLAFILGVSIYPFFILWGIGGNLYVVFCVTNGSEVIDWPWEWDWIDITFWGNEK